MAEESVGHYWSQAAKEREAMERHDREHPGDPTQWWQDCEICAERVCELCHGTGYFKSNTAEYEGDCPNPHCRHKAELEIDKSIEADMEHQRHGL